MLFQLVNLFAFSFVSALHKQSCLEQRLAAERLHQEARDRVRRDEGFLTWRISSTTATPCTSPGTEKNITPKSEELSRVGTHASDNATNEVTEGDHVTWYIPECDPITGDWTPLQRDSEGWRWCVHPATGEVVSEKSEILSSCEGCLMSRLVNMLDIKSAEEAGSTANNAYFPECQEMFPELYEKKQCWNGYFNACWCVDTVTGQATTFPSEKEVNCESQHKIESRENLVRASSPTWCQVIENLITHYNLVYPSIVSEYLETGDEGGVMQSETTSHPSLQPDIIMEIMCGDDGNFAEEQCLGEECWCVDSLTGHVREGSCRRSKREVFEENGGDLSNDVLHDKVLGNCLEVRRTQLEAFYEFALRGVILENLTIPKCTTQGFWSELQCSNQTVKDETLCWCVNQVTGQQTTGASVTLRSCETCWAHVLRAKKQQVEDYTTCDETGKYYTPIQCDIDGYCWCVDHVTGTLLSGALGTRPSIAGSRVTGEECEALDRIYNSE